MSDCMEFPKDWEKFIEDYSFEDKEEVYTNVSMLIPVFRVEQMIEHYFGGKWIPVTERLPEPGEWVLCSCRSNIIEVLRYDSAMDDWDSQMPERCYMKGFVTHWMPLPEPPEEVGK